MFPTSKYTPFITASWLTRQLYHSENGYRFRFNGQEQDNEVAGTGNIMTAEFWMYDGRLGRRWNVDPKPNEAVSVYACFMNNPIIFIDLNGDTVKYSTFGDRVNSFFGRVFNIEYRDRFNKWNTSIDIYTIKQVKDSKVKLIDARARLNQEFNVIDNSKFLVYYERRGFWGGIELPVSIDMSGQKLKQVDFLTGNNSLKTPNTHVNKLRRLLPGTDITLEAARYPDKFTISYSGISESIILGANDASFVEPVINSYSTKIKAPNSSNVIMTVYTPSSWALTNGKSINDSNTRWRYTYWKKTGIEIQFSIKIPYPKFFF